jgi:hypothetical protein
MLNVKSIVLILVIVEITAQRQMIELTRNKTESDLRFKWPKGIRQT